jgi:hypothetical protein
MTTSSSAVRGGHRSATILLRVVVVTLTLTTAAIHARLGGLLFTLNAIGYLALAGAMVLPGPGARVRWFVRLALVGFTVATVSGWVLFGARFPLAYLDKAVEMVLIAFLAFEIWLDGGPTEIIRRLRLAGRLVGEITRARR